MTPGAKTSEFAITIVIVILNALVTSGAIPTEHWSMRLASAIIAAAAALGYTISRAIVKTGQTNGQSPTEPHGRGPRD